MNEVIQKDNLSKICQIFGKGIIHSGEQVNIELKLLVPCGFNTYEIEDIDSLTEEIRAAGLVTPLSVIGPYPDKTYRVLSGERRLNALNRIHMEEPESYIHVPCYIVGDESMPEVAQKLIMEIANEAQRHKYDPIPHRFAIVKHMLELAERGDINRRKVAGIAAEHLGMSYKYARCYTDIILAKDRELQNLVEKKKVDVKLASILVKMDEEQKKMLTKRMESSQKVGDSWKIYEDFQNSKGQAAEEEVSNEISGERTRNKVSREENLVQSEKQSEGTGNNPVGDKTGGTGTRTGESYRVQDGKSGQKKVSPVKQENQVTYDPSEYDPEKFTMGLLRSKVQDVMGDNYDSGFSPVAASARRKDETIPSVSVDHNGIDYEKLEEYLDRIVLKDEFVEEDEVVYEKAQIFTQKFEESYM